MHKDNDMPTPFDKFLWWLATAEAELISTAVVDRNRYRIVGLSVMGTWLFASFSWWYFFYSFQANIWWALLPGLFMGFIILTIDRTLIKGINKKNKKRFAPILFRILLALTIGSFMAQPAVLFMFNKEIALQTSLDNEKRKFQKNEELETFYQNKKQVLLQNKNQIQAELNNANETVAQARNQYLAETDGSGGSGKVGLKDIALAKKNEYLKLEIAYQSLVSQRQPALQNIERKLNEIEENIKIENHQFQQLLQSGFLTKIQALNNLLKNNRALQYRYYLIVLLIVLIELMPVIAKMLLPNGSYDESVLQQEEMEIALTQERYKTATKFRQWQSQLAVEHNTEVTQLFYAELKAARLQKIKDLKQPWQQNPSESFTNLYKKVKWALWSKI